MLLLMINFVTSYIFLVWFLSRITSLSASLSQDEIKVVIFNLNASSVTELDGFGDSFYQFF